MHNAGALLQPASFPMKQQGNGLRCGHSTRPMAHSHGNAVRWSHKLQAGLYVGGRTPLERSPLTKPALLRMPPNECDLPAPPCSTTTSSAAGFIGLLTGKWQQAPRSVCGVVTAFCDGCGHQAACWRFAMAPPTAPAAVNICAQHPNCRGSHECKVAAGTAAVSAVHDGIC
jgi:hypothetical protein